MKTIRVVAAVICDSIVKKSKIFSTARGYGEFKGGLENPYLIRTPVVRNGKKSTLGYQPDVWKGWD